MRYDATCRYSSLTNVHHIEPTTLEYSCKKDVTTLLTCQDLSSFFMKQAYALQTFETQQLNMQPVSFLTILILKKTYSQDLLSKGI